jgi:hypothetical protein
MMWLLYIFSLFYFIIVIVAIISLSDTTNLIVYEEKNLFADAHMFTDINNTVTQNIDKYQLLFLPYPNNPIANDNSTRLNFSLMENKTDVYNVFVSLIIKDKRSGNVVVEQIPYKFYEFGDITFPYTFRNVSDYIITFQAKIHGDPKYKVNPLIANFDIPVMPNKIPFMGWIFFLIPILSAIPGIVVYMFFKRQSNNENSNSTT